MFEPEVFGAYLISAAAQACSCNCGCVNGAGCGSGQGAGMDEPVVVGPGCSN
jgi:hypothetical protein